jgi:hypothetical protein
LTLSAAAASSNSINELGTIAFEILISNPYKSIFDMTMLRVITLGYCWRFFGNLEVQIPKPTYIIKTVSPETTEC